MEESTNSRHFSGLYQMFIAAIRPSTFLQAPSSPYVMKNCSKSFQWSEMLLLSQCHPDDSTVEVWKATVLHYCFTIRGL
jgi:hypothetical protein